MMNDHNSCTTSSSFLRMFNVYDARDLRVQIIQKGSGLRTLETQNISKLLKKQRHYLLL